MQFLLLIFAINFLGIFISVFTETKLYGRIIKGTGFMRHEHI